MILEAMKQQSTIKEGQDTLYLRQDLSATIRKKRKEFSDVIEVLKPKNMFRGFAHPHRLRVLHGGTITLYDTSEDVAAFIEKLTATIGREGSHGVGPMKR